MREDRSIRLDTVHWYATPAYECSYLPQLQARSQVAVVPPRHTHAAYSALIQQGFRRSGAHIYRPACDGCKACVSVRINVDEYAPSRSQRRAAAGLAGLSLRLLPLELHADHSDLYQRYQAHRHSDTVDDSYAAFLMRSHATTHLLELRHASGQLLAVSVIDFVADGLSAVYSFFEPDSKGSLGTACVAWMVAHAKALGLPYVYLGYWIADSPKMAYKAKFNPLQALVNGQWQAFEAHSVNNTMTTTTEN